jgi:hypothetical protein
MFRLNHRNCGISGQLAFVTAKENRVEQNLPFSASLALSSNLLTLVDWNKEANISGRGRSPRSSFSVPALSPRIDQQFSETNVSLDDNRDSLMARDATRQSSDREKERNSWMKFHF